MYLTFFCPILWLYVYGLRFPVLPYCLSCRAEGGTSARLEVLPGAAEVQVGGTKGPSYGAKLISFVSMC